MEKTTKQQHRFFYCVVEQLIFQQNHIYMLTTYMRVIINLFSNDTSKLSFVNEICTDNTVQSCIIMKKNI